MEEDKKEEILEEKEEKIDEVKDVEKSDVKEVSSDTSNLDKTFVKEVKDAAYSNEEEKKKSKAPLIIVLLLVICLLCGLGLIYGPKLLKEFEKDKDDEKIENDSKKYSSSYRITGNGLEAFDLYFLQLENEEKNKVYSPLSIKYALSMLNEGTVGDSHKQIEELIGDYKAKKYPNNNHMSFANSMFIRDTFKDKIKSSYTNTLKEKYNADVITDSFTSPDTMNNWVSEKTFNLIKDLLDESVKNENFELINALAINMNWINRIQASTAELPEGMKQMYYNVNYIHEKYYDWIESIEGDNNYPDMKFNGKDNIKSVKVGASFNHYDIITDKGEDNIRNTVTEDYKKYLNDNPNEVRVCPSVDEYVNQFIKDIGENYKQADISTDFYISDNEEEKVFAKDLQTYDGVTLQYVGIMPKKVELKKYIENIKVSDISKIINGMKEVKYDNFKEGVITQIKGNIPLFNYEYELDLMKDLEKLNVKDVFDINKADLSNMLENEKQFISSAKHKANIEFSNDGIKAAAATSMGGAGAAHMCSYDYQFEVPVEVVDVTFDKPYMYIIRDKDSGEVWFTGTVYNPLTK